MYAVVQIGSQQFRVAEGDSIVVEAKADTTPKATVKLFVDGSNVMTDAKDLAKVKLELKAEGTVRGPKIRVFKFRPKQGASSKRTQGHRQTLTRLRISKLAKS